MKQGSNNIVSGSGSYNFENQYSGYSSSSVTFTIENLGNINLNLTGSPDLIAKSGTHAVMFTINQSSTTTPVTPSGSTTFSIVFRPSSTGNKSATISIANDDSDENPYTFTILGTGIPPAPEINIKQSSNNIPNSTGSYDFDNVSVGTSSSAVTFTIENIGVLNLIFSGSPIVELSGTNASEFSVNTSSTLATITPSTSTTFTITFSPTSTGNKTATVSIANNDTDENPYTFTITGECLLYDYGWTRRMGGTRDDFARSITTDSSGNVYLTGYFKSTVNFGTDFGVSDSKTSAGSYDIFITKITSSGSYGWTKQIGGTEYDKANSITIDSSGDIFMELLILEQILEFLILKLPLGTLIFSLQNLL